MAEIESQPPRVAWFSRGVLVAAFALSAGLVYQARGRGREGRVWSVLRSTVDGESRAVCDLVMALRGLESGGTPDWTKAAERCRALQWPRCDRPALEQMKRRSEVEGKDLESAPWLAMADVTWAFGSEASVRQMVRTELDRLPESDGPRRARVFLRFGIIDTNFDGQAALFNQACVADPAICDHMKEAAEREVAARFVAPGNLLPLYFTGGHPHAVGPR